MAARNPEVVLVDGPAVLATAGRHGLLDDHLFHDGQHPNLFSYVALSQDLLETLHARRALGWPLGREMPVIGIEECASHFGMNAARWSLICSKSSTFYNATAYISHDPSERLEKARRYQQASLAINGGTDPGRTGLASLAFLRKPGE